MSGLFAQKVKANSSIPPRAAGINLTTSVYGKPITIVYGTTRISPNLLLYGNFTAQPQFQQGASGGGGGKGGGGGAQSPQQTGYTYSATVAFALCEGPINGIGTVWQDKNQVSFGGTLFTGTFPQTAWSQAISWSYANAVGGTVTGSVTTLLGYNGIAYAAYGSFALGNSPNLPNLQFEVKGLFSTSVASTSEAGHALDADPSMILTDILTSSHHGAGLPASKLGGSSIYQAYCIASGLVVSPAYDSQRTVADIVDELGVATNSAPVWTSGQFSLIPYGDMPITANGFTYTPPATVYTLTDSDFIKAPQSAGSLGGANAPVVMNRKRASDKINSVKIEFLDRANSYAPSVAYANDQGLIDNFGLRSNGSRQLHLFCNANSANLSAHLQLRRLARISNTFQFDLDQRYILLDPMDIVAINDSALGLVNQLVRITEIQENDNGTLSYTAEEYLGTQGNPTFNFGIGAGYNTNPNTPAQTVNVPIIFEPPSALLGGQGTNPEVWIAACGGSTVATDPNWGGANVWLATPSTTTVTYSQIGTILNPARMGYVTAALAAHSGSNPDSTGVLTVDLTESGGTLLSGSTADAQVTNTLCIVGSELISYTSATLVSGNIYNLTGLYRGLYGTGNIAHASGEQFARLDGAIFKFTLNATYINQTLLVKLQSINTVGTGVQALSSATAYTYVPSGTAVLHPVGQLLNVGNVDSGVLTVGSAAVVEDYGYVTSQQPGGTIYHMPIGTDLGSLGGAFSLQLPQGTGYSMVRNTFSVTGGGAGTSTQNGLLTWVTFLSRTVFADTQPQILFGHCDASTLSSANSDVTGSLFMGFSTTDALTLWGNMNNSANRSSVVSFASTTFVLTSTATITSSGWHQITVKVNTSSLSTANGITLYLDNSSVGFVALSSGQNFYPGLAHISNAFIGQRLVGVSTTSTFNLDPIPSGFNSVAGYLAETYFIDGQALTSTSFTGSSIGPPLTFSNFVGAADAHLDYANVNSPGIDVSGKNNSMIASTIITSTMHTLAYPTN